MEGAGARMKQLVFASGIALALGLWSNLAAAYCRATTCDPADADQQARADTALAQVFDAVIALDGQLSGEHGIGLAKRGFMAKAIDAPTLELMRGFKRLFDPDGILNPGKVLP